MDLIKQVCTLKQAERLKELGVIQVSNFWYGDIVHSRKSPRLFISCKELFDGPYNNYSEIVDRKEKIINDYCVAAFTVAELGEMLPNVSGRYATMSYYNDHQGLWFCEIRFMEEYSEVDVPIDWKLLHEIEGDTEAEVRASMVIWCLEQGIVKTN